MQRYRKWEEQDKEKYEPMMTDEKDEPMMLDEEEDNTMTQYVPLHLAERNLLSHNSSLQTSNTGDAMVTYRVQEKGKNIIKVLFPPSQKVEALERNRECFKDDRPHTLQAHQNIMKEAKDQEKKQAIEAQGQASSTSSQQQQSKTHVGPNTNSTEKTNYVPEITGYSDTYDWDDHYHLPPNLTFSRTRHTERMARLADMAQFGSPLPLEEIIIPMQMNRSELFDKVDGLQKTLGTYFYITPDLHCS
ncbi:hypothetical protein GWK47_006668 [Chionoecetes opilio]|uniref:Uncharacterized protein n=1 Tax=Chionoecetes opilio TaxID=41210 RepID=A0A8J4YB98_CHIOP|nr:hypothetical protein GWK47_006668 [Chionoecetes opilio]